MLKLQHNCLEVGLCQREFGVGKCLPPETGGGGIGQKLVWWVEVCGWTKEVRQMSYEFRFSNHTNNDIVPVS